MRTLREVENFVVGRRLVRKDAKIKARKRRQILANRTRIFFHRKEKLKMSETNAHTSARINRNKMKSNSIVTNILAPMSCHVSSFIVNSAFI